MKNINFINPLSPKKYQACSKWLRISTFLMTTTFIATTVISVKQWYTIKQTNDEIDKKSQSIKKLEKILEEKMTLSKQEKRLTKQSEIIKDLQSTTKKKFALIYEINKRVPKESILKTISLTKNDFNLSILCDNAEKAEHFIKNIAALPDVHTVKLTSMQSNNQQLTCIIKGKIK